MAQYVCPQCRGTLTAQECALVCCSCEETYPFRDGLHDFSTRSHYWNQITTEQMEVLLEIARSHGYRYAIEKILSILTDKSLVGYVLDESRADFRAILPVTPETDVLDLGGGWGAVPCALAPACHSVTTVDTNPHTLEFIRLRAEQSGLDNLIPVRVDPLDDARLPFADGSFDVAVMNGVLEWVGEASKGVSPEEVQRRCLAEVRRVLKPTGALYVGIENRFALGYFMGAKDHSHLRYTSVLPRPLANAVMRFRRGRPYRTYTYSYKGYKRLLKSAGFSLPELYLAIPSYRDPEYILPAEDDRAIAYFMRRRASHIVDRARRRAVETLFNRLPLGLSCGVVRQLFYSYLMVAEAGK
jgi:SAM-dependent methyltransferase